MNPCSVNGTCCCRHDPAIGLDKALAWCRGKS
jgi:hypothetical protein